MKACKAKTKARGKGRAVGYAAGGSVADWNASVGGADFGAMQRKAGTAAAIAANQAIAANPGATKNIGGSGMDFAQLSRKVGVAGATRALRGEADAPEDPVPAPIAPQEDPTVGQRPVPPPALTKPPPSSWGALNLNNEQGRPDTLGDFGRLTSGIGSGGLGSLQTGTLGQDPLTIGRTPGLAKGGLLDLRRGGPVAGGPPGRDTVPAVAKPEGPVVARFDNGEYMLPRPTVAAVGGKPALDALVVKTAGKPPVGYGDGGRVSGWGALKNRGAQIDAAVDRATGAAPAPVPVDPAPQPQQPQKMPTDGRGHRSFWDMMVGNPPKYGAGGQVAGYALGGGLPEDPEELRKRQQQGNWAVKPEEAPINDAVSARFGIRPNAQQDRMLRAQEREFYPSFNNSQGVVTEDPGASYVPDAWSNYRAKKDYEAIHPRTGVQNSAAFGRIERKPDTALAAQLAAEQGNPATQAQQDKGDWQANDPAVKVHPAKTQDLGRQDPNLPDGFSKTLGPSGAIYSDGDKNYMAYEGPAAPGPTNRAGMTLPPGAREIARGGSGLSDYQKGRGMFDAGTMAAANENMRRGGGGGSFSVVGGAPYGVSEAEYAAMDPAQKSAAKVASLNAQTESIRDLRNARRFAEGSPPVGGWAAYNAEQAGKAGQAKDYMQRQDKRFEQGMRELEVRSGMSKDQSAAARQWDNDFAKQLDGFATKAQDGFGGASGLSDNARSWALQQAASLNRQVGGGLNVNAVAGKLFSVGSGILGNADALSQAMQELDVDKPTPEARARAKVLIDESLKMANNALFAQ